MPGAFATDADRMLSPSGDRFAVLPTVERDFYTAGSEIARGGMGRILSVQDRRIGRPVALKELLTTDAKARARFEREARVTALLQHPAIVPIYEVGTWENGEPFYTMRRVEGMSLDKLIERTPQLDDRLALLPNVLAVADALAYAHSRGVIHRDLKPANILIGAFGETVVIDWGLAKLLQSAEADTDDTVDVPTRPSDQALTIAGHAVGTPGYMPIEQANAREVDERADVYALGATLYHVLTGKMPYADSGNGHEVLAKLRREPPIAVDKLTPGVPSDLLALVDKAMARHPADRYASANELADDLRRFVTGKLVAVHRYTTWQLARRWVRRHRAAIAVAVAALTVLTAVLTVSIRRIVREQEVADRRRIEAEQLKLEAERSRADAEDLMGFMLGDLQTKLAPLGKLDLLDAVAQKARAYYEQRPASASSDTERKRQLALQNLGDVMRAKGDTAGALSAFRSALTIATEHAAADPSDARWQRALAVSHNRVGDVLVVLGQTQPALAHYRTGLTISEQLAARDPNNTQWQRDVSISHDRIAAVTALISDRRTALASYRASYAIREKLVAKDPANALWQRDLAISSFHITDSLLALNDLDEAMITAREGLAVRQRLADRDPNDPARQRDLSAGHELIGTVATKQGDNRLALASFKAALTIRTKLAALDPKNTEWQRDLSVAHNKVSDTLLELDDTAGAMAAARAGMAVIDRLVASDAGNTTWQRDLSVSHDRIGNVAAKSGDRNAALASYRAARAIRERLAATDPRNTSWQRDLAVSHGKIGALLRTSGESGLALIALRAELELRKRIAATDPSNAAWQRDLAECHAAIGDALVAHHEPNNALVAFRDALAIRQALSAAVPADPDDASAVAKLRRTIERCCRPNEPR